MTDERALLETWAAALRPDVGDADVLLAGLTANAELGARLQSQRWVVMRRARQAGATWERIGRALGVSRQSAWEMVRARMPAGD